MRIFGENLWKVFVFGSTITQRTHALSDIDIAIVLRRDVKEESRILFYRELRKIFGLVHPFEIHIITKEVWEKWYRNFIKNSYEEIP